MVLVGDALAYLSPDVVSLFYTTDPSIFDLPIIVFHGPATSGNLTQNTSRIQLHIFSPAGFQSYPRLTISPSSPIYDVVDYLPRDQQGDDVARALAFGLLKYFNELPHVVKSELIEQSAQYVSKSSTTLPTLFGERHAASLAAAMVQMDNAAEAIGLLELALQRQSISSIEIDLVLPKGTIKPLKDDDKILSIVEDNTFAIDSTLQMYGEYAPLIKLFGDPFFLPTSKLRRAPSKASSLNRSKSFLKDQKLSLRREMGEFVDTEERYLIKLHELVNHIAADFRRKAKLRSAGSSSPSEGDIEQLFPESLDRILDINTSFLAAIQQVMDNTEEEAMQDLEADQVNFRMSRYSPANRPHDPTGAVAFANVLLQWFPRFSDCYQDYIRSSQDFPKLISSFVKQNSSFSKRVQQTGEQRLRSAIIEPVQRLPRYSLFIDNIVNYLPATHPALYPMLRARDMITAICALDIPNTDKFMPVTRLRNLVEMWPKTLLPQGRLISAVDVVELKGANPDTASSTRRLTEMLLLFRDTIIVLKKSNDTSFSARGLMMEVEKPFAETIMASMTAGVGQQHVYDLALSKWYNLSDVRFSMTDDGKIAFMTSSYDKRTGSISDASHKGAAVRAFLFQGIHDGKAAKWLEDVCKARIEGRFSEVERESDHWGLRNVNSSKHNLNIFTSVFEEGVDDLIEGRKEPAPIRIVVDHEKGTKGAPVGHYGVEIVASLRSVYDAASQYKLEVAGLHNTFQSQLVSCDNFLPTFLDRVSDLLRTHFSPSNPALSKAFIRYYSDILKSLRICSSRNSATEIVIKSPRPTSPVKLISNFLNSTGSLGHSHQRLGKMSVMSNIPSIQSPALARKGSKISELPQEYTNTSSKVGLEKDLPENNLIRLEQTFTAYMAALQACRGDVVGKNLRSRNTTSELQVNALYNTFIENPSDVKASTEATFNVIFCAFEKFLKMAWIEQMGAVITLQTLRLLREKNALLYPGDFADFIKTVFADMAPQNKRAFISMIRLLADLLDGCGNDGDRGALIEGFADLLVAEGNSRDFINLLDRLVEESDRLFEEYHSASNDGCDSPHHGSVKPTLRNGKFASKDGSLTSNSSLRKRFGFDTLLRQNSNSKNEVENRSSMWRTLNKATKVESTYEDITRGAISRSQSIDASSNAPPPSRNAMSHSCAPLFEALEGRSSDRPCSSQLNQVPNRLSMIRSSPCSESNTGDKFKKHKRRSSLSDLMKSHTLNPPSPPVPATLVRRALPIPTIVPHSYTSPRTPFPPKQSIMNRSIKWNKESPDQKENVPLKVTISPRNPIHGKDAKRNVLGQMSEGEIIQIKDSCTSNAPSLSRLPSRQISSTIPVPRPMNGLPKRNQCSVTSPPPRPRSAYAHKAVQPSTPRPKSSYAVNSATMLNKPAPTKLRLQSTVKLRERLAREKEAIATAEVTLTDQVATLSKEAAVSTHCQTPDTQIHIESLQASIQNVESVYKPLLEKFAVAHAAIEATLESSLAVSEFKVKELDQLYREASAENDLMYERFNGELTKIIKSIRMKDNRGKEDLIAAVRDAKEEVNRVRKENGHLKREMASLKTILRAGQLP